MDIFEETGMDSGPVADPSPDLIGVRILAAASEQFAEQGVRKTSVEDVARRAGVARITVYRRFKNKDVLIENVVIRELLTLMSAFEQAIPRGSTVAIGMVEGAAACLRAINGNPLFKELLLWRPGSDASTQSTSYDTSVIRSVTGFIADQLRREQQTLRIPADQNLEIIAELLTRLILSYVISPAIHVDFDDDEQVCAFVYRYLVPMLGVRLD